MKAINTRMHKLGWFVVLASASLATPLFAQGTLTPEQLSIRVEKLSQSAKGNDAAVSSMQQEVKNLTEEMARLGRLIDNRALLEMLQRVDLLSEEISQLTGAIEVQGNDIGEIKQRQRELYLDIDRRLRDLESRAPATGATQSQPALPTLPSSSQSASLPATTSNAAAGITDAPMPTQSSTPSVTQSEEKAAYQAAFDTLKEGRYKQAKTELSTFLQRYPTSSFAGNAQYWLGEAHYVTRNFDQGIVEFEKVLKQYGNSNKVPDAMLKLGYTYYELKQFEQSKAILLQLREGYAKSTAARLAGKRLDRIRKEGQ